MLCVGEGVDYTTLSTNVTIFAGSSSQSFNVSLTDDNILEPTEQFEIEIKAIHLIGGQQPIPFVLTGAYNVATGTVLDDDGKITVQQKNSGSFT